VHENNSKYILLLDEKASADSQSVRIGHFDCPSILFTILTLSL
jgi:hypothetical protein